MNFESWEMRELTIMRKKKECTEKKTGIRVSASASMEKKQKGSWRKRNASYEIRVQSPRHLSASGEKETRIFVMT